MPPEGALTNLGRADSDAISVVISTYERAESCERAVASVLRQTKPPLEVLVCDDGSSKETLARLQTLADGDDRVRCLPAARHAGTPAVTRNLGIAHARAPWVAFLDDDDEWLPEKLDRQCAAIAGGSADVIASNAIRSSGGLYFADHPRSFRPSRGDIVHANPLITSSVVVRRELAGFPTPRWLRGVEDYAAWLALADRGARFLVLGDPLVRYEDSGADRLSAARARGELAIARMAWRRALRGPPDTEAARAAARKTAGAAYVAASDGLAWLRRRAGGK